MSDFLRYYLDHEMARLVGEMETRVMAAIDDLRNLLSELGSTVDEAVARIDEDVAELRRRIDAGTITAADLDSLRGHVDRLRAIDPDPAFPAAEPEPGPEPEPGA